jgi:tetratricopeptide (TPR) repeat protein
MCYRLGRNVSLSRPLAVIAVGVWCVTALEASDWTLARSAHSEVFSQAGEASARSMALLIERLHALFSPVAPPPDYRPPVRVVVFRSTEEYEPYRLGPTAGAYYMGSHVRDYIVMPALGPRDPHVAAHEYWHLVVRDSDLQLPLWLEEGLAQYFSNVCLDERDTSGADQLASRFRTLHGQARMPLSDMLVLAKDSPLRNDHEAASLFYAQSWALTEMLLADPTYSTRFPELFTALASGMPGQGALLSVYAKSLTVIGTDLRTWIEKRGVTPVVLPDAAPEDVGVEVVELSPVDSGAILADLLATADKLDRAESIYRKLAKEAPDAPDITAGLARIALKKGDDPAARQLLRRMVDQGMEDDDALFNLALLDNNAGAHEAALADLQAMRHIAPAREFAYWTAIAYAASQLGRRADAEAAATNALAYASNATEQEHARELRLIAQTDVVVQLTRDTNGQMKLVHTRTPHGSPDWNPFIEPDDQVRRAEGKLRAIECGAQTVFEVETAGGTVRLAIPDPFHVQIRNAPSEFTCGPQPPSDVSVVYAASGPAGGILRGLEFR